MFVEPPAATQAPVRSERDKETYAHAPAETSFITILTAVNASSEAQKTSADNESPTAVENKAGESESRAVETESTENTGEGVEETAPAESVDRSENGESEGTDSIDTETLSESPEETSENIHTDLDTEPPESPSNAPTPGTRETSVNGTDDAIAVVSSPPQIQPGPQEAKGSTGNTQGATHPDTDNLDLTLVSNPEDTDAQLDGENLEPIRPFPKSLNALLAERAVRSRGQAAQPISETSTAKAVEAALTPEPPSNTDETPSTDQTALPQTRATEIGGVRSTQSTPLPRIPLSNLPGEIAQQIHLIQKEGASSLRLRISPENLGDLKIEVHRTGETVRVTMVSPNPHVRDALDSQMAELRRALSEQGLTLDGASVEDGSNNREENSNANFLAPRPGAGGQEKNTGLESITLRPMDRHTQPTILGPNGINLLV